MREDVFRVLKNHNEEEEGNELSTFLGAESTLF